MAISKGELNKNIYFTSGKTSYIGKQTKKHYVTKRTWDIISIKRFIVQNRPKGGNAKRPNTLVTLQENIQANTIIEIQSLSWKTRHQFPILNLLKEIRLGKNVAIDLGKEYPNLLYCSLKASQKFAGHILL
jgi:hypothetical protein